MINKIILVGNVGKDVETKHFDDNQVSNFSLATSETYKDKNGEKQKQTEWHNVVLWGGLSKVTEKWVKKGDLIYIEGKIATRKWQDKEGNDRYTTEIVCSKLQMLGGKKETQDASRHPPALSPEDAPNNNSNSDNVPF